MLTRSAFFQEPAHAEFARLLRDWHEAQGRKDLPWQIHSNPYGIWVSEIMLQQTRVRTVIPYYQRFMARFPRVAELAKAPEDEVLAHWAGLGYYARARHLHQAAHQILETQGGRLPETLEGLMALPGIGRSTAGAILSLALDRPFPILDGNVKRVLTRCFLIPGRPGSAAFERRLWTLAEDMLPQKGARIHNQALMDLGAGPCARRRPDCAACPLTGLCAAHRAGLEECYPEARRRPPTPERHTYFLILLAEGRILLERRPAAGLWGGLWVPPECVRADAIEASARARGVEPRRVEILPARLHTFSHFRLHYHPVLIQGTFLPQRVREPDAQCWHPLGEPPPGGLPAPILRLLAELRISD